MENQFKCEYCGKTFKNITPHKCINGFRKHHLRFTNLNPSNKDKLRQLKDVLKVPRNLDIFDLADYIQHEYGVSIVIMMGRNGTGWTAWMNANEGVIPEGGDETEMPVYPKIREAVEAAIIRVLDYVNNGLTTQ